MVEVITFNGTKFRRYPESSNRSERVYYTPGIADRQRGVGRLHEEIWKATHGAIPHGCHIHHVDFDPLNNAESNLVCLTAADHVAVHLATDPEAGKRYGTESWQQHLDTIRPLASAWHSSPDGIEWHREHGRRVGANLPLREATCERCGDTFKSKRPRLYCSGKCRAAARRASGADDETRTCAQCGAHFTTNRYSRALCCSKSCATKHRYKAGGPIA